MAVTRRPATNGLVFGGDAIDACEEDRFRSAWRGRRLKAGCLLDFDLTSFFLVFHTSDLIGLKMSYLDLDLDLERCTDKDTTPFPPSMISGVSTSKFKIQFATSTEERKRCFLIASDLFGRTTSRQPAFAIVTQFINLQRT